MIAKYLEMISVTERVYHGYLRRIKRELEGIGVSDINSVHALLIFHIADKEVQLNEIAVKANYLGFNTSYIIKKLRAGGYICSQRSTEDLRVLKIWLTEKGYSLWHRLKTMHDRDLGQFSDHEDELGDAIWALQQIEQFWIDRELERLPQEADHRTNGNDGGASCALTENDYFRNHDQLHRRS